MAHFAQLDSNNTVVYVAFIDNEHAPDEATGIKYLEEQTGQTGWIQTSYNRSFRKHYAGLGYTYDAERDAFIPPRHCESCVFDEQTCSWQDPQEITNE